VGKKKNTALQFIFFGKKGLDTSGKVGKMGGGQPVGSPLGGGRWDEGRKKSGN